MSSSSHSWEEAMCPLHHTHGRRLYALFITPMGWCHTHHCGESSLLYLDAFRSADVEVSELVDHDEIVTSAEGIHARS